MSQPCSRQRPRRCRTRVWVCAAGVLAAAGVIPATADAVANLCVSCHALESGGLSTHRFGRSECAACHGGQPEASDRAQAHRGLIASPGAIANAETACGRCHAEQVRAVTRGPMHTLTGLIDTTRAVLDDSSTPPGGQGVGSLAHGPADSLLRKLCVSCHLGQAQTGRGDPASARGGGCLACHLARSPGAAHPDLSARVGDERCFGCHARSGRISLSYAGLAEADEQALARGDPIKLARLTDGRLVERREADVHHRGRLACIDCHTRLDVMGGAEPVSRQGQAVDIECADCHLNRAPSIKRSELPADIARRVPFAGAPGQPFLTTRRHGTPLWHIEPRADGLWLHRKVNGGAVRIPPYTRARHPLEGEHARLTCSACHSPWAPRCYGCHISFDPLGTQWDHAEHRITAGRWTERRWAVGAGPPALGVTAGGMIAPFVPGMILSVSHPAWPAARFRRLFAAVAPHTTGRARACDSCHGSPEALGLGRGELVKEDGAWRFRPAEPVLADGLPADAWTGLAQPAPGASPRPGDRFLTHQERLRILDARKE